MEGRRPLPEDLVVDILLRLPVESLLPFKCVCKHWYPLIKSSSFIQEHFHHKNNRARLLVCNSKVSDEKSAVFSLLPKEIVPGLTPEQKTLLQVPRDYNYKCVAGPVDGLFLVQKKFYGDDLRLDLWNPATREFRHLPPPPFPNEYFFFDYNHQFGLGFDLLTQDYKVVWVRVFWDEPEQGVYPHVYSSRNNSWKNLTPGFSSSSPLSVPLDSTYLNGVYFWLCMGVGEMYRMRSVDMGSEQFGDMQVPDIPSTYWGALTLRGDSLAILTGDPGKPMTSIYDVWVLKQEGNWSKVLTVQPRMGLHCLHNIWDNDNMVFQRLHNIWDYDKMVFQITETSQLVLYDPTTRQVTDLEFQLDLRIAGCWVFNYKESLASNSLQYPRRIQDSTIFNRNSLLVIDIKLRRTFIQFIVNLIYKIFGS